MLKIITNHNKQDVVYSFTLGQNFPNIEGKLLRVELSGAELSKFIQKKEIPICDVDSSYLIWHDGAAGGVLKILREIL
jgi:hypothetical protein